MRLNSAGVHETSPLLTLVDKMEDNASMKTKDETEPRYDSLCGQFFHTFKDGEVQYQGRCLRLLDKDTYLVQYFRWLDGHETHRKVVKIDLETAKTYSFYDTVAKMDAWYINHSKEIVEPLD